MKNNYKVIFCHRASPQIQLRNFAPSVNTAQWLQRERKIACLFWGSKITCNQSGYVNFEKTFVNKKTPKNKEGYEPGMCEKQQNEKEMFNPVVFYSCQIYLGSISISAAPFPCFIYFLSCDSSECQSLLCSVAAAPAEGQGEDVHPSPCPGGTDPLTPARAGHVPSGADRIWSCSWWWEKAEGNIINKEKMKSFNFCANSHPRCINDIYYRVFSLSLPFQRPWRGSVLKLMVCKYGFYIQRQIFVLCAVI